MYSVNISAYLVSKITEPIIEKAVEWQSKPLEISFLKFKFSCSLTIWYAI